MAGLLESFQGILVSETKFLFIICMPSNPPREHAPNKKLEILGKREKEMEHALKIKANPERVLKIAEKIRITQLNLI